MIQPRIRLHYRPLRVGWVVISDDLAEFEKAVRLSCCLWGGRFNPIVPTRDSELARNLVHTFGVDLLIPIQDTPETKAVIDEFPYLIPPGVWDRAVFVGDEPTRCLYADIYHPARRLYEEANKTTGEPKVVMVRPVWESNDPLAHVLTAVFGDYPDGRETGFDYRGMLDRWLKAE